MYLSRNSFHDSNRPIQSLAASPLRRIPPGKFAFLLGVLAALTSLGIAVPAFRNRRFLPPSRTRSPRSTRRQPAPRTPRRTRRMWLFLFTWEKRSITASRGRRSQPPLRSQVTVPERRNLFGWSTWHFRAALHTQNPVRKLFTIDDEFDSYADAGGLDTRQYETYLDELGRTNNQVLHFVPVGQTSRAPAPDVRVLPGTRDPVSVLYALRAWIGCEHPSFTPLFMMAVICIRSAPGWKQKTMRLPLRRAISRLVGSRCACREMNSSRRTSISTFGLRTMQRVLRFSFRPRFHSATCAPN